MRLDRAALPVTAAPVTRPPRGSSKQPAIHQTRAEAPSSSSHDSYFPPTPASDTGSFPPQARSAFASTSDYTRREAPRYSSRVDSKPLRELEDILDSFADGPRRTQPPLPADASSVRSNSVRSAVSHQVTPLQYGRAQQPAGSGGMIASSSSSSSLSAPGMPFGRYTAQHDSFHSHSGFIGSNSPIASRSGAPLGSPPLSSLSSSSDLTLDHPLAAPPSRHKLFNPSNASSNLSSSDEAPPSPAVTQVVRKISIKKDNDAPVRLVRNGSLQQQVTPQRPRRQDGFQSTAEQDVYSQLGFDNSSPRSSDGEPSFGHSPATTPTTPASTFSPPLGGGPLQRSQPAVFGDVQGFAPLNSHTLDVSYKSATMSIYGMYDEDRESLSRSRWSNAEADFSSCSERPTELSTP